MLGLHTVVLPPSLSEAGEIGASRAAIHGYLSPHVGQVGLDGPARGRLRGPLGSGVEPVPGDHCPKLLWGRGLDLSEPCTRARPTTGPEAHFIHTVSPTPILPQGTGCLAA